MIQQLYKTDLITLKLLHNAITDARGLNKQVISLLGSANLQKLATQKLIATYLELLIPYLDDLIFIIGGRGEEGSIMHTSVDYCFQAKANIFIVGAEPIFDLEGKVLPENIFGFQNISLRCYALTQLSDLMIAFPGGIGTLQEMIVPMMHRKLDVSTLNSLKGPASIFVPTELENPVTDFLKILNNRQFISNSRSPHIIPVTLTNFPDELAHSMPGDRV